MSEVKKLEVDHFGPFSGPLLLFHTSPRKRPRLSQDLTTAKKRQLP